MRLKELYDLAVATGMKNDPRGEDELRRVLEEARKRYDKLDEDDKSSFDTESLSNPYSDTRVMVGDPDMEITGIIAGIDMEVGEVLLADRLNERGADINLVLAHHPEGKALASLADVMSMQADVWHTFGVPINIAEALIGPRMGEVRRNLMPVNHARATDAARLLGLGFITIHTAADNMVTKFVQDYLDGQEPRTLRDVVKALRKIPEYEQAALENAGPSIVVGDSDRRAGKIAVDMTGGTEGPEGAIEKLADAGVGTLVGMHYGEKLRKKAEERHINVVVAGHIASDTIGLNRILDAVEAQAGPMDVVAASGFRRVRRD
ncbi:MAG: NGG1p interacting factor NIF3 [Actinobacteria bacterium]|nr:MAG: NGG1p interacting factor NIF3 [Actinomycetota bacterium]